METSEPLKNIVDRELSEPMREFVQKHYRSLRQQGVHLAYSSGYIIDLFLKLCMEEEIKMP